MSQRRLLRRGGIKGRPISSPCLVSSHTISSSSNITHSHLSTEQDSLSNAHTPSHDVKRPFIQFQLTRFIPVE